MIVRAVKQCRIIWLLVLPLLIWSAPSGLAQQSPATQTQEARDIQHAIRILNGTWKLKERTNPDGSLQRWEGTTVINLQPFYPQFGTLGPLGAMAPRALGTVTVQESGLHDPKCPACVPEEFFGKRGQIESNGTWTVSLLPKDHARFPSNGDDFIISVTDVSRIAGDYTPYQEGFNPNCTAFYRIPRTGNSAALLNPVGIGFFPVEAPPLTNRGEVIPPKVAAASG
jgi:hypothetical protein